MSQTPHRQLSELTSFFEAVAEGISENDRGARAVPKLTPVPAPAPALDAPALLDSMRALLAEELRNHVQTLQVPAPEANLEAEAVVAGLTSRIQELEVDIEQHAAQKARYERQLSAALGERDAAQLKATELERAVAALNARALQHRDEFAALQSHGDSLRIEFGRQLEANEEELKRLLFAADERLRDAQEHATEHLDALDSLLNSERAQHVEALASELELHTQALASAHAAHAQALSSEREAHAQALASERANHAQVLASERQLHAQALAELRAQVQADASKKRSAPAAFLSALPVTAISTPAPVPAQVEAPKLEARSAQPAAVANSSEPAAAPPSAAEIEREKHRLAVLALGTEVAPAKLYFQLLPWQGLKATRVSVAASRQTSGSDSLTAFAAAAATRQAITSSRAHASVQLAESAA